MLTKPLIFILTFALTIVNFAILLIPVSIIILPILIIVGPIILQLGNSFILFIISRISLIMILYVLADYLFGYSVWRYNRHCIAINKAKHIQSYEEIAEIFNWLKNKFNVANVSLFVSPSKEVNAFAVGSMRKNSIILTRGILETMATKSKNHDQYIDAIKGILGHEMSHISNRDYLPGLLTNANIAANNHISTIFRWLFTIIAKLIRFIPIIGRPLHSVLYKTHNIIFFIVNFFLNWLFMPIYNFLQKWLGRSVEYRCDKESADAFGGKCIATGLSMLGKGSYFSVFSTHPRTKSRINYVKELQPKPERTLRPSLLNSLANFIALLIIITTCLYSTDKTNIPGLFNRIHQAITNITNSY